MTARAIVTVQLRLALALATMPGQYRALVAHAPLAVNSERGFFYPRYTLRSGSRAKGAFFIPVLLLIPKQKSPADAGLKIVPVFLVANFAFGDFFEVLAVRRFAVFRC